MRKPLSFSLMALIAFFAVIAVILFSSFIGSSRQSPDLPTIPDTGGESSESLDYSRIEINAQNAQDIVAALNRPADYYSETTSELFYDNTSTTYMRRRWTRGSISRIDVVSDKGGTTMSAILTDADAYYWVPGNARYLKMSRGNFTADNEQMMMDYSTLLALPKESIIDANLSRLSGEQCIYVEAELSQLGYTEKYWISTQNGLLLLGQTLEDGQVIYSIQLTDFNLTRPEDIEFTLPDKTVITAN